MVAFHVDRITGWMASIRKSARSQWKWGVRAGTFIAALLAVLVPILTSEVSGGIKAAVSIFVAVVALAGALFSLISHFVKVARTPLDVDESEVDKSDMNEEDD
ncbi:hypothetical protein IMZ48_21660, partial [Candidatus Bathyarchaeota archaeon]|nr:hypothetical protein [Candidatus Bathyarchaeota archaeon]